MGVDTGLTGRYWPVFPATGSAPRGPI